MEIMECDRCGRREKYEITPLSAENSNEFSGSAVANWKTGNIIEEDDEGGKTYESICPDCSI